jgi:transcription antitermination factor NusG
MHKSPRLIWYAAYTKSKAEKRVAVELQKQGIEHYLPLQETIRQWSDRKKKVLVPLINSYIFVRIVPKQHMSVLLITGVVRIVHFEGRPVPIPDWQIKNLKIMMGAELPISIVSKEFVKGGDVHITHGPLKGMRGKVIQIKGQHKLAITIDALEYNLTIDIDPAFVEPMRKNH